MKKIFYCFLFFPLLFVYCERNKDILNPAETGNYLIKYGTFFNMCDGYCKKELVITGKNVTFIATGWNSQQYPEKSISGQLTESEYQHLLSLIDMNALSKYDDIIGCPDCADGGGEWIEKKQDNQTKKITFEYNATLESINDLIEQLRDIFKTYDNTMFPALN